ncbi:MAG: RNA polymerase sigma factor [Roseiflexus sp.]
MAQEHSWYEVVQECQTRIVRIRAVLTTGSILTPELQADLDAVILTMRNWIIGRIRRYRLNEDEFGDVLLAVIEQLHRDLRSPGFSSMERKFGAYIATTVNRILFERRKAEQTNPLSFLSLDAPTGDDGLPLYSMIEDKTPEQRADTYQEEQIHARLSAAIAALPAIEREVVTLRLNGVASVDIARKFGMSPANVTHIYNRAVKRLKQNLTGGGAL